MVTSLKMRYKCENGSESENLALQNIQARLRMVISYLFAQMLPTIRKKKGFLLMLGSSNVDECIRGYFTKYDCSSADINPIGSISKEDLRKFITECYTTFDFNILKEILYASPTAELIPLKNNAIVQNDEQEMGFTYKELNILGRLRKVHKCGPLSMLISLLHKNNPNSVETNLRLSEKEIHEIKEKTKKFFRYHNQNRHKMTVLTPAYHAENYSPDDNRFDMRPFLYPNYEHQFNMLDKFVEKYLNDSLDVD